MPVGWPGAAEEARRCLDELGLAGVAIGSRGGGRDLDDPVNDELWALLAERRAFVFLHPSGVPDPHRQRDFWLPQLVGYPMETALAVARLVFGGVLERFPLTLCLAHGGGCLPALRGRMDMGWERKDVARTTAVPPSALTDRLYYDTAVFSPALLRRLVEDVGAGHVLLGTDHPFELADFSPLRTVAELGLDPADARPSSRDRRRAAGRDAPPRGGRTGRGQTSRKRLIAVEVPLAQLRVADARGPPPGRGRARRPCPGAGCGARRRRPARSAPAGRPATASGGSARGDQPVGLPRLAVVGEVGADDPLEVHPEVAVVVLVHVARTSRRR